MLHRCSKTRPARAGFTLVELLVVILIIAVLITLLLGVVHLAQNKSRIAKTKADLAAIATALEQYHSDFKTYPGVSEPVTVRTILAQALIGPGPFAQDGADGSGFRIPDPSTNPPTFSLNSRKWEAYLSPEHFKVQQYPNGSWAILDYFGNPIRYYPKRRSVAPNVGPLVNVGGIFDSLDGEHPGLGFDSSPLKDPTTNQVVNQDGARDLSALSLQIYLGDIGDASNQPNNVIDGAETFYCEANFILASSGPDGFFTRFDTNGTSISARRQLLNRSDDILNFDYK